MVLLLALLAGLLYLVIPPFAGRLGEVGKSVEQGAQQVVYEVGRHVGMNRSEVDQEVSQAAHNLRSHLTGLTGDALAGVGTAAAVAGAGVLVLFLSFFLLRDGPDIWSWLVGLAPRRRRAQLDDVVVQQIEAHVLYPVVVGPRLELHPLVVMLAVALGGTLAGIAGAFLAVPVATVGGAVLRYAREQSSDDNGAVGRPPGLVTVPHR